jgi:hypothetical protein
MRIRLKEQQMSTTAAPHQRGSQKLLAGLAKNGETPNPEEIIKAFSLPAGVKIPNWHSRGVPADYLTLHATVETPLSQLGGVIDSFVKLNDSSINLHIFINGIPFPDLAHVVVRNTPGER